MSIALLLAQDIATPQQWQSTALGALAGLIAGLIPQIISLYRTWNAERRIDKEMTTADRTQLIKDLRAEREEIKKEFKNERQIWQGRIDKLDSEHRECIKESAALKEKAFGLEKDIEELQRKVAELTKTIQH